jgi:hypothetical protein
MLCFVAMLVGTGNLARKPASLAGKDELLPDA